MKINERIEDFIQLKDGWYQGDGSEYNVQQLNQFVALFQTNFDSELNPPNIFPMVDGTVQLEWVTTHFDVSLNIELEKFTAELHSLEFENEFVHEEKLNLNEKESWEKLNNYIANKFKQ
jgi:hypothetical protein